ncbi:MULTISPECIES: GntR family transcriptional regulator [Achromobacter]|uniref:GntR family transcriptional regulator n=1 Tax=Alcaligenes xylosoxydans xylosoxydans TaxID=85698 RepID=A0A424WEH8_ALCXX|nr:MULTISPECIES: GntR family transcriptional regulator [Achromobacter]MBC9905649.1 GntR family transcriptional regulator [Achromobacter xylosoxidans]MBD0869196.1 GntR family transcriptional regulator [Achromobacter xylosoxidans]QNP85236.1 GntR family transcriptional regulator [Achromobacter xylosoxidans]RPJ91627.1 GntR family transcriptional regulator [Achromobacter xylosoxidans]WLW61176.1 GntR family transcriptional regulator [Achromobacter aegrifaciens]
MAAAESKRRAADVAYDQIESMIATLQLQPGSAVVEADLVEMTGLGRTPLREALLRMVAAGLIRQEPRRGLRVSMIQLADHMDLIQTRRALEQLIAASAARRATAAQRSQIVDCAAQMIRAAEGGNLDDYMHADQMLDHVCHQACRNASAVNAVAPLIIQCRRFWYAYQHEGDIAEGARRHMLMAEGIATGNESAAIKGADSLMDYLEMFTRKVIDA